MGWVIPLASVALGLFVGAFILLGAGVNPIAAYREMAMETFGNSQGLSEVLVLGFADAEGRISLIAPDHDVPDGARLS